ncbi:hypothetical protein ACI3SG_28340, partial [Klebsiella pneumoniae]
PRKGQDMFCSTATTVAILQNAWSGHSPDTPVTYSRLWGVGKIEKVKQGVVYQGAVFEKD